MAEYMVNAVGKRHDERGRSLENSKDVLRASS